MKHEYSPAERRSIKRGAVACGVILLGLLGLGVAGTVNPEQEHYTAARQAESLEGFIKNMNERKVGGAIVSIVESDDKRSAKVTVTEGDNPDDPNCSASFWTITDPRELLYSTRDDGLHRVEATKLINDIVDELHCE